MKKFRIFYVLLMFVLLLAPMNTFAATSKTKINYVSLGDSLAASMLHDSSIGTGFVGNIKNALEADGYKVDLENYGVPGFTSQQVLNKLDQADLSNADFITISAGANDLLQENLILLQQINTDYLNPTKVQEMKGIEKVKVQNKFNEVNSFVTTLNNSINNTKNSISQIKEKANTLERTLYSLFFKELDQSLNKAKDATSKFSEAKSSFDTDIEHYESLLDDTVTLSNTAIDNINNFYKKHIPHPSYIKVLDEIFPGIKDTLNNLSSIKADLEQLKNKVNEIQNTNNTYKEKINEINNLVEENQQKVNQLTSKATSQIANVGANIANIIGYIKQVNPNANIYVMGYYNALPYLPSQMQSITVPLIQALNNAIQHSTVNAGAVFIPTYSLFEGNYSTYLPNPTNIHPSETGYSAIANAFLKEISKNYPPIEEEQIEKYITIQLGQKVKVYKGQQVTIEGTNTTIILPDNLPDGTFLTVTETEDELKEKVQGLKVVGDVLNFNFELPNEFKDFEGKYQLIMGYNNDTSDNLDIYYYDEQSEQWIKQNGEIDTQSKEIHLEITHFSNYGVFVKEDEPEQPIEEGPSEPESPVENPKDPSKEPSKPQNPVDNPTVEEPSKPEGSKENPVKPIKKSEQKADDKKSNKNKLPKTATDYYNLLIIGLFIMFVGVVLWKMNFKKAYNKHTKKA